MPNNYSSIYDIKDFILNDITPKYFTVEDISLLNSGLYGMITDTASTIGEDTMRVTSRYITELIPGQAKLPEFIYANAANYGITDIFATCAKCQAMLFIKERDVLANGVADGRYQEYTIDADLLVYIDDIPFSIPADIKIRSTYYNGNYNHRCYWDTTMTNSTVIDTLPYIKCAKTRIQGESELYIAMGVTLYQYERIHTTEPIISNTTLNIPYVDITFDNTLCNFEVMYTSPSGVTTQLSKLLTNAAPTTKPFIYYSMQGDNVLRLLFSNDDRYFTPEYGAELSIYRYECLGSDGNFPQYRGENIYVAPKTENTAISYNNTTPLYCTMIGDSNYGRAAYTLDEIGLLTAEKQITVDSITTDNDLTVYFNTSMSLYNTIGKVIKIRDDFANRIYSCYTRLRDDENIFPTNTVNIEFTLDKLVQEYDPVDNKLVIPAGSRVAYKGTSIDTCEVLSNEEEPHELEYATIGVTVIDKEQTTVACYMNSVDKTVVMDYKFVNDNSLFQFIAKSLTVKRDAILGDTEYTFTLVIAPTDLTLIDTSVESSETTTEDDYSGDTQPEETTDEVTVLDLSKLKIYIFVETNSGHYIEMNYVPSADTDEIGYTFECKIGTDDVVNSTNIKLEGLTFVPNQQVQDCYTAMQDPPMKILIAYDEGTNPGHDYTSSIPAIEKYTMCNIFQPKTGELYLSYPLELLRPTLEFQPASGDYSFSIFLWDVPVVGRAFILSEGRLSMFLDRLTAQHDFLQDLMITSNYGIYMRFFNTYGRSRIFTVTSGALLNYVNCNLKISIQFNDGVEVEEYLNDIKITIKEYIESMNSSSTSSGINSIKLSLLSKLIHETYNEQINYVVMGSINGYNSDIQTIIMGKDLTSAENKDLIPEFLTIDIDDIEITIL